MSIELKEAAQQALKELGEARKIVRASSSRQLAKDWDRRATDALANLREAIQQTEAQQPATAIACGIPGMTKTTCPYCEQGFAFEHEQPTTTEPVGVNQLRKELSDANDFIQSLADLCVKYETLLGYRKTKAPEGASELAEARGESNVNTELDLAMPDSICDHVFVLDPKSSIRICNKCGTVECKKHTRPAPSVPATSEPVGYMNEGHIHELAMRRLPYGYVYPEAGAGASTAVYAHPAPSVPDDDFDLICNAIDKADTITMEGDYMLDSDDCIAVVRVMQVLLSVRAAMLAAK